MHSPFCYGANAETRKPHTAPNSWSAGDNILARSAGRSLGQRRSGDTDRQAHQTECISVLFDHGGLLAGRFWLPPTTPTTTLKRSLAQQSWSSGRPWSELAVLRTRHIWSHISNADKALISARMSARTTSRNDVGLIVREKKARKGLCGGNRQMVSGTISMAPQGHSTAHRPHPLQKS